MRIELIDPFLSNTLNVIQMMSMTELKAGPPTQRAETTTYGVVTGIVPLTGTTCNGHMVVSFDAPSILGIVGRMLGESFPDVNNQVADAVGEIANMICGGAKRDLAQLGVSIGMATPKVVLGENTDLGQLANTPAVTVPFATPEGTFVIEAALSFPTVS
ncbi:MAG: chemotaxis protein CheX [Bdellovibrionota bacterium]